MMNQIGPDETATDGAIGQTLRGGLYLSIAVMLIGALGAAASSHQGSSVVPLARIFRSLFGGNPAALLDLGILLLFATPLAGVVVALVRFLREKDRPFVLLTAALLVILAAGFAVALR
ncbi:MAG TPA: DUF1634 domain-containing protein [Chloroflexota bacterium]|nr:DUF1634 domain-containing protein [Chloroflexota bacterium]